MRAGILSRVATMLVMLASLLGLPGRADACSCVGQGPPCERFWEAQAVFVGRVVGIVEVPPGEYVVGVNVRTDFRGESYGQPVFFPGLTSRAGASTVHDDFNGATVGPPKRKARRWAGGLVTIRLKPDTT